MSLLEKVSNAKHLLALLGKLEFSDITKAVELVQSIQSEKTKVAEDIRSAIQLALLVAKYTDTKKDDYVLGMLAEVVGSPGFIQLADLVEDMLESGGVPVKSLPPEGIRLGNDDKEFIPLPVALQIAQIVVSIVMYLRKKKND